MRRFDVRMGMELSDALGAPVTCVAVSHDGNCILAACTDGALRLLDKEVTPIGNLLDSPFLPAFSNMAHDPLTIPQIHILLHGTLARPCG